MSLPDLFELSGGQLEADDLPLSGGTLSAEVELQPGVLEYDPAAEETHWEVVQW